MSGGRNNAVRPLAVLTALAVCMCLGAAQAQEVRTKTKTTVRERGHDDFKMARRWEKGTAYRGRHIVSSSHEDLGTVDDVVLDPSSGRILYGVVSFGPSIGTADRLYAIPWETFEVPADNGAIVLNVDRARIKDAPSFERDRWPNFDREYAVRTYKYYDVPAYWDESETRTVTEKTPEDRGTYIERWNEAPRAWSRTSEIIGMSVRNRQNEDFGRISDVSVDPDTGRILYGIVSYNGKLYSIPWPAFETSSDSKYLIVDMPKERYTNGVSFETTSWPVFTDEPYATKTYTYYNVEPYWTHEYKVKTNKHGEVKIKEKRVKH